MTLKRKLKYKAGYYRRCFQALMQGEVIPAWLRGRTARVVYLSILTLFLVAYVREVSSAATSGYEMRDLQNQVSALNEEIRGLNVQVAADTSLPTLQKRLADSGLTRANSITYLNSVASVVAKK
jgi:hypothetical protein